MVDALKRASAKRITVVLPFYGYARQDKKHRGREPISARLMADLFKAAGADRLMAVDLHTARSRASSTGRSTTSWPCRSSARVRRPARPPRPRGGLPGRRPDQGRRGLVDRLGGAPLAFIHKTRDINRPNEVVANRVVGEIKGRVCVLVDDMIDTGGTITKAADALMDDGAQGVVIAATHGILTVLPSTGSRRARPRRSSSPTRCRSPRPALRQADRPVHRAARVAGDPRGLRGRPSVTKLFDGKPWPRRGR